MTFSADIIDTDRRCRGCGYSLRGLRRHGVCPECAMPIQAPKWIYDPIDRIPAAEIRPLRLGAWMAALAFPAMVAAAVLELSRTLRPGLAMTGAAGAAVAWCIAIALLTRTSRVPQAAVHGLARRSRLRPWTRALAVPWVPAALLAVLLRSDLLPVARVPIAGAAVLCAALGLAGLVLAALVLERLSEWARDESAERIFRAFTVILPAAVMLLIAGAVIWSRLAPLIVIFTGVGLVASLAAFPLGLVSIARSLSYAVGHAEDYLDRQEHRERQQRRDADAAAQRPVRQADRS